MHGKSFILEIKREGCMDKLMIQVNRGADALRKGRDDQIKEANKALQILK